MLMPPPRRCRHAATCRYFRRASAACLLMACCSITSCLSLFFSFSAALSVMPHYALLLLLPLRCRPRYAAIRHAALLLLRELCRIFADAGWHIRYMPLRAGHCYMLCHTHHTPPPRCYADAIRCFHAVTLIDAYFFHASRCRRRHYATLILRHAAIVDAFARLRRHCRR